MKQCWKNFWYDHKFPIVFFGLFLITFVVTWWLASQPYCNTWEEFGYKSCNQVIWGGTRFWREPIN